MDELKRKFKKESNLWWVAALSVLGFFACAASIFLLKYFSPAAPAALPAVPTFTYFSPTPVTMESLPTLPAAVQTIPTPVASVTPYLFSTPLPSATPTSGWSWFYPPQPTSQIYLPLLQANVITLTPTLSAFPAPPMATPDPNVCKNILYPARPGSQWTYSFHTPKRSGDVTMSVIAVESSQAIVDSLEHSSGATARTYVQCDGDVILNFPLLSGQKLIGDMVNGAMSVDYVGGVLAPNAAAFTASNWALAWNIQYRIYGSGVTEYNGSTFAFEVAPSDIQMTCQTLGAGAAAFETVTVAAGSFNALKVICRGEGQATALVNGSAVTGSIFAQATQWFAPNVGLLKSQSDYASLSAFGITLPLSPADVSGWLELRSYAIGQ